MDSVMGWNLVPYTAWHNLVYHLWPWSGIEVGRWIDASYTGVDWLQEVWDFPPLVWCSIADQPVPEVPTVSADLRVFRWITGDDQLIAMRRSPRLLFFCCQSAFGVIYQKCYILCIIVNNYFNKILTTICNMKIEYKQKHKKNIYISCKGSYRLSLMYLIYWL